MISMHKQKIICPKLCKSSHFWCKINKAFTLVELIVVITILAILWTIAFISLQWYSETARDSTRISDISSMKTSLELFQLDAGKYPKATDWVDITYSWATVWNQGTFWESVYANVDRLDKIPTDPSTDKLYTYSTTKTWYEYQIWGIFEGDTITMNNEKWTINSYWIQKTNAWTTEAIAYVSWNYNWEISKTLSWTTCNLLAVPTIITNDTTVTDLQDIITNNSFVYRWYKNLPWSFKDSKFKFDWWFDFQPNSLVAYTDTWSCDIISSNTNSWTLARVQLLKWLQDSYSGTILQNEWEIKNILSLDIDTNNPSNDVINYAWNLTNNTLWTNIIVSNTTNTWNNNNTNLTINSCKDLLDSWTTTSWDYSIDIPWLWLTTVYCDMSWLWASWPYDTLSTAWNTKLLIQSNVSTNWWTSFTDSSDSNHTIVTSGSPSNSLLMSKNFNSSIRFPNNWWVSTLVVQDTISDFNFWTWPFTIDFWVSFDNLTDKHWLFWRANLQWLWLMFNHDNDKKLNFFVWNWLPWWSWVKWTKTDWVSNTFYHIAIVWESNTYYVFVNGKLDIVYNSPIQATEPVSNIFFWNSPANISLHQLHWYMDEIRVVKWEKKWDWLWHSVWDQVFTSPTFPYKYTTIPSPLLTARSCKQILDNWNSVWDWFYDLDYDWPWWVWWMNTYCDMTNGWRTLAVRAANNWDVWLNTTWTFWTVINPNWTSSAKIAHEHLQYIVNNSVLENPVKLDFPEASVNRYVWKNCSWTEFCK